MDQLSQKLDALSWLQKVMPGRYVEFTGTNANDLATALVAKQSARWQGIFDIVESDPTWRYFVNELHGLIKRTGPPQMADTGSAVVVESSVPIIIKDTFGDDTKCVLRFPDLVLAYALARCRPAVQSNSENTFLAVLFSRSAAEIELLEWLKGDVDIQTKLKEAERSIDAVQANSVSATQMIEGVVAKADQLIGVLEEKDRRRQDAWNIEKAEIVAGLKREAEEAARIESSIDLWETKAKSHNYAFIVGASIFSLSLIATVLGAVVFGTEFVKNLANEFSGPKQYFGIGLLLVPTLAIAWIIRVIVRVTLQSLSLSQDARQRHTQILTYLRMLGDSSHPISDKERILALSAIFRPLAGQATDDVSPPTVAELLREAIEGSTKVKSL